MAARKDPAREIRVQTQQVTLLGLKRLEALLSDPDASNADVLKGLSLLFERVCEHPGAAGGAILTIPAMPMAVPRLSGG